MTDLLPLTLLVLLLTSAGLALVYWSARRQRARRQFVCAHCASSSAHNARTLEAWRNGKARFFCEPCHQAWQSQHSAPPRAYEEVVARRGCLGLLTVLLLLPTLLLLALVR